LCTIINTLIFVYINSQPQFTTMTNKLIAFRNTDQDGDIWSETAIVFRSEDDVKKAFQPDSEFLISLFTDPEDEDRTLQSFKVQEIGGIINSITFWTEYAHETRLVRMYNGYIFE